MKVVWLLIGILLLGGCGERFAPVAGDVVIVTNIQDGSISFIEEKTQQTTAVWKLKKAVMGTFLLPDGDTIGVYGKELPAVYLYSLRTGKEAGVWELGKGIANALVKDGMIFLANQERNEVQVLRPDGQEAAHPAVGQSPLTMTADEQHVYVLDFHDSMVTVIDAASYQALRTWRIPKSSAGAVVTGGEMWVGGHGEGAEVNDRVRVYDVKTGALLREVPSAQMPVAFAADGQYVYVLSHGSSTLRKVDSQTYSEVAAVSVGANPFAVQRYGDDLYVASYDSHEVYIVDAAAMKIKKAVETGKGPFQLTERRGKK